MALVCVLVDDDEECREVFRVVLEMDGWSVFPARNGAEALALVAAHDPDLIITDLAMPHTDGLWLIDQVRQRWPTRRPILVLTGQDPLADALRRRPQQPTACQVLLKPVLPDRLIAAARALAEHYHRRSNP